MDIKKFGDFINEDVKIPVLDVLIDDNGNLYNGKIQNFPLRKGNIIQKKISKGTGEFNDKGQEKRSNKNTLVGIIGADAESYPGGIDKNGVLVAVNPDNENFLTKKGRNFPEKGEVAMRKFVKASILSLAMPTMPTS